MIIVKMEYTLKLNNKVIDTGITKGVGNNVYELTEYVADELSKGFEVDGLSVDYVDVSNVWTFEREQDGNVYVIEFKPLGIKADKYSVDEAV